MADVNPNNTITVKTNPPDLFRRMRAYPVKLKAETDKTANQALYHVWGSVPSYPAPPPGSTYIRTGTLGRSLGVSSGGQPMGKPDVMKVTHLGGGYTEARLGTRLTYAPHVIGTGTQARHMRHWWTMATVAERARKGVIRLYEAMADRMADFLVGRD